LITMVYSNVTCSEFACMRRYCCQMMKHHAAKHGYTIGQMSFPPGNQATWYCRMCKNGHTKEMIMRAYRDPVTGKVMLQCSQDMMSDAHMKHMMHEMHAHC